MRYLPFFCLLLLIGGISSAASAYRPVYRDTPGVTRVYQYSSVTSSNAPSSSSTAFVSQIVMESVSGKEDGVPLIAIQTKRSKRLTIYANPSISAQPFQESAQMKDTTVRFLRSPLGDVSSFYQEKDTLSSDDKAQADAAFYSIFPPGAQLVFPNHSLNVGDAWSSSLRISLQKTTTNLLCLYCYAGPETVDGIAYSKFTCHVVIGPDVTKYRLQSSALPATLTSTVTGEGNITFLFDDRSGSFYRISYSAHRTTTRKTVLTLPSGRIKSQTDKYPSTIEVTLTRLLEEHR